MVREQRNKWRRLPVPSDVPSACYEYHDFQSAIIKQHRSLTDWKRNLYDKRAQMVLEHSAE